MRLSYGKYINTLAAGKALVDRATTDNSLAIFYWHVIGEGGDLSVEDFEELLDYIIAQGCEVVTFADLMPQNP
ncbi:hypothetical protein ES707_08245 [subsurface metagenome]